MDHRLRRGNLIDRLPEIEVDAFLVTGLPNVRYLTGFTGSNGQALIAAEESVFFTDGRYTERSRHEVPDLDRVTYAASLWESLADRADRLGIRALLVDRHFVPFSSPATLAMGEREGDGEHSPPFRTSGRRGIVLVRCGTVAQ